MKFLLTMNMPSRNNPIHQIICDHPSKSLNDFCRTLETTEFTIVEEFYKNDRGAFGPDPYYSRGMTAVNYRYVGKIKILADASEVNFRRND